ncbi:hypothetical protein ACFDR9_001742 [Janthinobacterium sp. CG_23.3]|uniref:hypothetical protein n=1 Tax=Janthinobacterium sp. CG_23.3 TaxID=3349634 RepID=UPI0038D4A143
MKFINRLLISEIPKDLVGRPAKLVALCIYMSVYLKDFASGFLPPIVSLVFLALGGGVGTVLVLAKIRRKAPVNQASLNVAVCCIAAWCVSMAVTRTWNASNYYIAIVAAFVVVNTAPRFFLKLLVFHFVASVAIQGMEFITGDYFFVYKAADGDLLNEELFGGGMAILRTKGMFQGPLSAVAFGLWMAFIFRGSALFAFGLLLSAYFATGRLGMSAGAVLLLYRFFVKRNDTGKIKILLSLLGVAAIAYALFKVIDADRLDFISAAFNLGNDQNVSRVYFWQKSLIYYLNYSSLEMIFGNFGFIGVREGGTENDFLRIALDNGAVCLVIYLSAILLLLFSRPRRDGASAEIKFMMLMIIALMNIFPYIQSLSSTLLFWIFMFIYLKVGSAAAALAPAPTPTRKKVKKFRKTAAPSTLQAVSP